MNALDLNTNLLTYSGSTVLVGVFLRMLFIWWMKGKPGVEQASANSALYTMLREEMDLMRKELRLVKKQLAILEMLAAQAGIDVQAEYAKRGLYDESDNAEKVKADSIKAALDKIESDKRALADRRAAPRQDSTDRRSTDKKD